MMPSTVTLHWATLADTEAFGRDLGAQLEAGDVVILSGDLGAGKTALTKSIAVGMGIDELITSPTFVIARVHHGAGVSLVHVDAYRLADGAELDDLDLDADVARAAVVIEWGEGMAEQLAADPLHITVTRNDDDSRTAIVNGTGRWADPVAHWAADRSAP